MNRIGGEHVDVISVVSGGDSPVTYQPTDAQVTAVMRASAYFRIGVPFENGRWFQAIERSESLRMVDVWQGIKLRRMQGHTHHGPDCEDDHGHGRPSIWVCSGDTIQRRATWFRGHYPNHPRLRKLSGRSPNKPLNFTRSQPWVISWV